MFDRVEISKIPGMIEPVEQKLLYDMASQLTLQKSDQFVEFGTFFGRSTACLAQGLADNKSRTAKNKLHAYDSFSCATNGGFVEHVKRFAIGANVEGLIEYGLNKIDFYPVFEKYLSAYIETGLLRPVRSELSSSTPDVISSIGLMHIDSPKFYDEFKIILYRFFPLLRDGAIVVFQDYFYHWSATLIAAVEALRLKGCIEYRMSAASSLIVQFNGPIKHSVLLEIDIQMSSPIEIEKLLMSAINQCNTVNMDRSEIFIPRLWLASIQYLWVNDKAQEATEMIARYFKQGGQITPPVLNDLLELMKYKFSMREYYEEDH